MNWADYWWAVTRDEDVNARLCFHPNERREVASDGGVTVTCPDCPMVAYHDWSIKLFVMGPYLRPAPRDDTRD